MSTEQGGFRIDENAMSAEYAKRQRSYQALAEEASFILEQGINDQGIKIHAIENRVKSLQSIISKCKLKDIEDPFDVLTDLVGCRVICLFRSDIDQIDSLITQEFLVKGVDNKVLSDTNSFGYMSVHYIVALKDSLSGPRYTRVKGIRFEIQVRSLAMHAWASISHYLAYKGEWDVPDHLRKSLNALSGLFYIADNEFERFYHESEKSKYSPAERSDFEEINFDTIRAMLLAKFPDRRQPSDSALSELVREIKEGGYKKLSEVGKDIDRASKAFEVYEGSSDSIPEDARREGYFQAVGAARISLEIASDDFHRARETGQEGEYDEYKAFLT
jgi:putative GTP pyrophosphokinase